MISMGKNSSKGGRGGGGKGSSGYGRGVSQARLGQKTGSSNAFGGWAKVQKPNGDFRMRPSK